jgi:SAM-dependent methyltransferase
MKYVEHYKDFYRAGDAQQRLWRGSGAVEKVANIISIWPAARTAIRPTVIDIGCGDGAIAAELAKSGFFERLDGFDVSESGVAIAKDRSIPKATFATYDGDRLPVDHRAYDLAVLSHVVEHVEEPRALLREAARVARWVVVEVPLERHARLRGDFVWTDTGHINFYDLVLIRRLVQSCGLSVVAERVSNSGRAWARATNSRKLLVKWAIRECLLRGARPIATSVLTYNGIVLASSTDAADQLQVVTQRPASLNGNGSAGAERSRAKGG